MTQAHYDDPDFSYVNYWKGREYEHESEVVVIKRLLGKKKFDSGADIGGGYGRLSIILADYCKKVYLVEPAKTHIDIANKICPKNVQTIQGSSDNTKIKSKELDLVLVVRVSHHLPDLAPTVKELSRILSPGGILIFEIANAVNFKSRLINWLTGRKISYQPIERRSQANIKRNTIAFVNHHPNKVIDLFTNSGFRYVRRYSVSNFRSPKIKILLPIKILLVLEKLIQWPLGYVNFGPSIFVEFVKL